MRSALLGKIYPWLLPLVVTLLLVLSLAVGERLRSNTVEGKFNRIHLGMDEERVDEILGPSERGERGTSVHDWSIWKTWDFDDHRISVGFYQNRVIYKTLSRLVDGPGCVLPIDWGEPAP